MSASFGPGARASHQAPAGLDQKASPPRAAFTPGPWWTDDRREVAANRGGGAFQVMAKHRGEGSSYCVASVNHWESPDANARLISAAPELLRAVEAAEWRGTKQEITYYGRNFIDCCPVCFGTKPRHKPDCELSAALAKARGEQP